MFKINRNKIEMVEGDYGIFLPITIETDESDNLEIDDNFRISIYKTINGVSIIEKNYTLDDYNTFKFYLSETETKKLGVGYYYYDLDWYRDGNFLNNIIAKEQFIVKEKARLVNES